MWRHVLWLSQHQYLLQYNLRLYGSCISLLCVECESALWAISSSAIYFSMTGGSTILHWDLMLYFLHFKPSLHCGCFWFIENTSLFYALFPRINCKKKEVRETKMKKQNIFQHLPICFNLQTSDQITKVTFHRKIWMILDQQTINWHWWYQHLLCRTQHACWSIIGAF